VKVMLVVGAYSWRQ